MSDDSLTLKLVEIEKHLQHLSPEHRAKLLKWIKTNGPKTPNIDAALEHLTNSFATIRVLIKYMQFDLEVTRRENQELRNELASLRQHLIDSGEGFDTEIGGYEHNYVLDLPDAVDDAIDLPEMGDYIHNEECNHPYDPVCECLHCKGYRIRMRQQNEGAD